MSNIMDKSFKHLEQANASQASTPNLGLSGFLSPISNTITDVSKLTDKDKNNNGEAVGSLIGSGLDVLAMSFGIPTGGLGNKLGSMVGSQFNSKQRGLSSYELGGSLKDYSEIEGDEVIFSKSGVDHNNFQMLDNKESKYISDYGLLVKGKAHTEGGINAKGDVYVASKFLGIDGEKANKDNKSVADLMLKYGIKTMAKDKDSRFNVTRSKGALKHHLDMLEDIQKEAENGKLLKEMENKIKVELNKNELNSNITKQLNNNKMNGVKNLMQKVGMKYGMGGKMYEEGGMMQEQMGMEQTPEAMMEQEGMMQDPAAQQDQVMQLAQAALQGDEAAMQQLVQMLGEEQAMQLLQQLQSQMGGEQGQANPSQQRMEQLGGM